MKNPMSHSINSTTQNILIVDDEEDICKLIQGILQDEGYTVQYSTNMTSALKMFKEQSFNACILDVWLHDSSDDGIQLMGQCLEINPLIPIIMMSGHSTVETAVQAIKKGAYDFIEKPFKTDRLLVIVQRAIEYYNLKNENKSLKDQEFMKTSLLMDLAGETPVFKTFKNILLKTSHSKNPVLIYGESGTGKKTAAKFIHQNSTRAEKPCLILNFGHTHSTLEEIETQLFGQNQSQTPIGLLEQAQDGTLILDRISNIPLPIQRRILTFLEKNGLFCDLEGNQKKLNVRLIGTYDCDMLKEISEGRFLKDLFYLLNVLPIKIPLLHERKEDIPLLINSFYKDLGEGESDISHLFTEEALNLLKNYAWPGNIKQLKNFVEWFKIIGLEKKNIINAQDLPPYLSEKNISSHKKEEDNDFIEDCLIVSLKDAREKFETLYLQEQLERFGYNISKTSAFIGMERSALHRKLNSLGLQTSHNKDEPKDIKQQPPLAKQREGI